MKAALLIDKIDAWIDEISCNNFHFIPGIIISSAQMGRINILRSNQNTIDAYFRYSSEVYKIVRDYKPAKLLLFLERVLKYAPKLNNLKKV